MQGITLVSAQKNTISGNDIASNQRTGIILEGSNGNLIEDNKISENILGISLDESSLSNRIYRNNFFNNLNVNSKSATSIWSTTTPFTYTYLGKKEQSRMGNYWSDYRVMDKNGDGIGDSPYVIVLAGNPKAIQESARDIIDAFPLMDPTEYYSGVLPLPLKDLSLFPTPLVPVPTVSMIPATIDTTTIVPVAPAPTPSPASVINLRDILPFGSITLALGVLFLAVLAGAIFMLHRKQKAGMTADSPDEAAALTPAKATVFTRSTRSPVTTPVQETSLSHESTQEGYYAATSDQKYYFPRELENKYTDIAFIGRGGIA
jgi:parallel beta-helix repeat protein